MGGAESSADLINCSTDLFYFGKPDFTSLWPPVSDRLPEFFLSTVTAGDAFWRPRTEVTV